MPGPMNALGLKHTCSCLRNAIFQNFLDHAFLKKKKIEIFLLKDI